MKQYEFKKEWLDLSTLTGIFYNIGDKITSQDASVMTLAKLERHGFIEEIKPKPTWRERYEARKKMLMPDIVSRGDGSISDKMLAHLKILCYVEWANEGKKWGDSYWAINLALDRFIAVNHPFSKTIRAVLKSDWSHPIDIFKFKERSDVWGMLEIPELVEALEVVFNVKNKK
jgi:hypothetical protein